MELRGAEALVVECGSGRRRGFCVILHLRRRWFAGADEGAEVEKLGGGGGGGVDGVEGRRRFLGVVDGGGGVGGRGVRGEEAEAIGFEVVVARVAVAVAEAEEEEEKGGEDEGGEERDGDDERDELDWLVCGVGA